MLIKMVLLLTTLMTLPNLGRLFLGPRKETTGRLTSAQTVSFLQGLPGDQNECADVYSKVVFILMIGLWEIFFTGNWFFMIINKLQIICKTI